MRSEGCGALVLKRLSQAEIDGDRIWGLVKGSAINQSGASAAMPVPNGPAQERAMEDALARAGAAPDEVDYLEAHGTGTELGDSIELRALTSVYGKGRQPERPLLLGSVKTNIGHAEWASGMASIIKVILSMRKGIIPAHLHFNEPNPDFDWERTPVQITSEKMAWPAIPDRPPLSAVNSFGMSGANAHLVLEGWPSQTNGDGTAGEPAWPSGPGQPAPVSLPSRLGELPDHAEPLQARSARILPLSGKSPEALRDLAGAYLSWLESADLKKEREADVERYLADAAWTAGTGRSHFPHRAELVFKNPTDLRTGLKSLVEDSGRAGQTGMAESANIALVYSGAGKQWSGIGELLYRTEPVFRSVLDRCDELHRLERGESLLELVFSNEASGEALWRPESENLAIYSLEVALTALWESAGVRPRTVLGRGIGEIAAAHAAGMLTLEDGLRLAASLTGPDAALPIVPVSVPSLTFVSGVTGSQAQNPGEIDNDHWRRLAAGVGAFQDGLNTVAGTGVSLVVALGPVEDSDKIGTTMQVPVVNVPQWHRDDQDDGSEDFARAVASAYEAGAPVNFRSLFAGEERRKIAIPGYPFQRRSFWVQKRRETQ